MKQSNFSSLELHNKDSGISRNINSVNIDVVAEIQKELEACDLVSLVFLLYDVPDTALQCLIVYQRVCRDIIDTNTDLLCNWVRHTQFRPSWRYEFLEALTICQLYNIIRKLGFDVSTVRKHFPDNINFTIYINPVKKILYKLAEEITTDNLLKLKKTLLTYEIDVKEYESCELIFLHLICRKFVSISNTADGNTMHKCQLENLVKIIKNFPTLKEYAVKLTTLQNCLNNVPNTPEPLGTSTPSSAGVLVSETKNDNKKYTEGFDDLFAVLTQLQNEDVSVKNLKSDSKLLGDDVYVIKDPKRVGVCYIINQEEFHPSKYSIECADAVEPLQNRLGSTRDKLALEETMSALNFEVICHNNLDHKQMIESIKSIVQYRIHHDHSIFVLCILSHGVRDHVYGADSVKVNVEYIQNILDSDDALHLRGLPKIMILQACQVDDVHPTLVADSPKPVYYLKKSDFLVYWATAPEFEAYRDEKKGSIFIQYLCFILRKRAHKEHVKDIFTKVTDSVIRTCSKLEREQVPMLKSTLRKKVYLQIPE